MTPRLPCWLVLAASLAPLPPAHATAPSWMHVAADGTIPSPRAAAAMVALDGELVAFGGYLECFDAAAYVEGCDNVWYADTYRFALDANRKGGTWSRRAIPGPSARGYVGAARWGDSVVMYGGGRFSVLLADLTIYGDLWQYFPESDPGGERWVRRTPLNPGPGGRMGPGVAVIGDDLYLFGGISPILLSDPLEPGLFRRHNDLWVYHLDHPDPALRDTWELLVPDSLLDDDVLADGQPDIRYIAQFAASEDGTRLFLFGGNELLTGTQRDDLWIYDIAAGTWTRQPSVPDAGDSSVGRTHGGSAVDGEGFVVTMGDKNDDSSECATNEPSSGQKPTNQTWRFDVASGTWSHLAGIDPVDGPPPPLKRIAYAEHAGALYVWGGFDYRCPETGDPGGPVWNTDVWALDLDAL